MYTHLCMLLLPPLQFSEPSVLTRTTEATSQHISLFQSCLLQFILSTTVRVIFSKNKSGHIMDLLKPLKGLMWPNSHLSLQGPPLPGSQLFSGHISYSFLLSSLSFSHTGNFPSRSFCMQQLRDCVANAPASKSRFGLF